MTAQQRLADYRSGAFKEVGGWVADRAVDALHTASFFHEENGLRGDALEIGVFHGRFFLALMAALRADEVAVAVDIFDNQALNIDKSGHDSGLRATLNGNIQRFAHRPDAARIIHADSMTTGPQEVVAQSTSGRFRLISVDGGHTAEHVMNDLSLVSQIIAPGGVIFLDDFHSPHWPGVFEGFVRYMSFANRNLAPVLYTGNKLLLTTISHQPMMTDFFRERFQAPDIAEVKLSGFSYIATP